MDAREIALLKKIRIETGRKIDTLYAGEYRSAFRGQGLSFEAVREYNLTLQTFPSIIWAKTIFAGKQPMAGFTASEEAQKPPQVKF